ncbi:uncharacterized protein [Lepidochelys kempii]|uniref:uncharacterized protein n=1 Tax=Lepidochelys kempii TaxID=8472 RepID=UPI003C6EBFC9
MRELGGRRAGPSERSAELAGSPPLSRALFPVGGQRRGSPSAPQPPEALRGAGAGVAGTERLDAQARVVLCTFPWARARRAPLTRQEAGGEATGSVDSRDPRRGWTFPSLWNDAVWFLKSGVVWILGFGLFPISRPHLPLFLDIETAEQKPYQRLLTEVLPPCRDGHKAEEGIGSKGGGIHLSVCCSWELMQGRRLHSEACCVKGSPIQESESTVLNPDCYNITYRNIRKVKRALPWLLLGKLFLILDPFGRLHFGLTYTGEIYTGYRQNSTCSLGKCYAALCKEPYLIHF